MEFKINGTKWRILNVDEATINNEVKQDGSLGLTIYKIQTIMLLKNQANIIKTLKHELMHVWLYEYGHNQSEKEFNCEDVCEIVSSGNDFINEIVRQYSNYEETIYYADDEEVKRVKEEVKKLDEY